MCAKEAEKPLLILGAGSFAAEAADLVSEIEGWRLEGFVQNLDPHSIATLEGLPVYWLEKALDKAKTHWAVCAIGAAERRGLIEQVARSGMRFATLVHPWTRVSKTSSLGEGAIVSAGAVIATRARLGRHVIVNRGALIGHHVEVGDYATIGPGANICGSCSIGEGTLIGAGAVIRDHVAVGAHAVVGIGAVVTRDVPDGVTVFGVPARILKGNGSGL